MLVFRGVQVIPYLKPELPIPSHHVLVISISIWCESIYVTFCVSMLDCHGVSASFSRG